MTFKNRLTRIEESSSALAKTYAGYAQSARDEGDTQSMFEFIESAEEILGSESNGFDQEHYLDS